jgi:hypothetical protein
MNHRCLGLAVILFKQFSSQDSGNSLRNSSNLEDLDVTGEHFLSANTRRRGYNNRNKN